MNNIKWSNISALLRALSTAQNGGDEKKFREALLDALLPILPKILDDYDPWNSEGMERKAQKAHAYQAAERDLSDAYIRLRTILGTLNAGEAPTAPQVWEHTEAKAQTLVKSHTQLQWALRDLLAQTRDLDDRGVPWEGYQSDALLNAIATADALVGTDVTEQFPIADEPLNRRIQELEVALAEEKKKKQGSVFINEDMLTFKQDGVPRVVMGRIPGIPAAFSAPYSGNSDERKMKIDDSSIDYGRLTRIKDEGRIGLTAPTYRVLRKWSEEDLRGLIQKVMAEREAEIADKFQETQAQLDHINDTIASAMRYGLTKLPKDFELHNVVTVNGPDEATAALIKDIIREEMRPGGRIHAALMR